MKTKIVDGQAVSKKAKGFISEFKEFVSRGNVVDMAVGVVVGTAFTGIVNSLVKEIIMPFVGWLIGGIDFSQFKFVLKAAEKTADGEIPEVAILYGSFINQVINFFILAFVVFTVVKVLNSFKRKKEEEPVEEAPAAPAEDIVLLTEIRDLLKK